MFKFRFFKTQSDFYIMKTRIYHILSFLNKSDAKISICIFIYRNQENRGSREIRNNLGI